MEFGESIGGHNFQVEISSWEVANDQKKEKIKIGTLKESSGVTSPTNCKKRCYL